MTLGGVRQTAILTNDSAALELVSGGHLAPPVPSIDPDRLTCGVRVLALFLRPGIEPGAETRAKAARWSRPAFVPRTTGRCQEMTGTVGASNPQVSRQIWASPQVARSDSRTLSRWRHGFKSRWDYKEKRPLDISHRSSPSERVPRRSSRPRRRSRDRRLPGPWPRRATPGSLAPPSGPGGPHPPPR